MKTVKSNVRRSLCQRKGIDFKPILRVDKDLKMGEILVVPLLFAGMQKTATNP
jgi:hypothetical protein